MYVLIKSTESFLKGAVAGSRKVWGIRLCNVTILDILEKAGLQLYRIPQPNQDFPHKSELLQCDIFLMTHAQKQIQKSKKITFSPVTF